jgi:hypothetical protein
MTMLYRNHSTSCFPIVGGPGLKTVIITMGPFSRLARNSGERIVAESPGAGIT